jgi:excinuclease UvrABC ATPase subunit
MATDRILIRGAREHNLKSIDLEIPREKLAAGSRRVRGPGEQGKAPW